MRGLTATHGLEQGELGGRKLEIVAVEALRLLGGGDPEEEHGDVGGGCRGDGLGGLLGGRGSVVVVARRERHLGSGERADLVERVLETGRVDERTAGALVSRAASELTDHGDRCRPRERQDGVVVLEQHDARRRGLPRERVVGRLVVDRCRIRARGRLPGERDDAGRGRVERRLVELARAHGCDELGVGAPFARGHLEVEAGCEGGDAVGDRAPVRDDEPLEAPLVAQH